ncbi:hypothetical protein Fcan01_13520 [Folsomia candida]|uniref:Uncharacterized protein n=1 Tax=Folsomia candida TaxID=158441 RepID=A0A226E4T6_FOLCA|nr:hypothetical protein Fcan01_13520 [Folsomia candida]
MADEVTVEINYDSGSDESDGEEVTTLKSSRDSNALLDSWLRELDSLTTQLKVVIHSSVCPMKKAYATLPGLLEEYNVEKVGEEKELFSQLCVMVVVGNEVGNQEGPRTEVKVKSWLSLSSRVKDVGG